MLHGSNRYKLLKLEYKDYYDNWTIVKGIFDRKTKLFAPYIGTIEKFNRKPPDAWEWFKCRGFNPEDVKEKPITLHQFYGIKSKPKKKVVKNATRK